MPIVSPDKLARLQQNPSNIRNICILAHVDHGKTSLTDALIATNGIISPKMAGKIRYLDSRPDEQERGITMESSAISLYFGMARRPSPEATPVQTDYLIELIDSPGHVDFSSEVSTASRLCDGALILVDAVEGVSSQTVTVLRQAWLERLKPLLVINKLDRLVTELKMTSAEAYIHLSRLLEQVNAVLGTFFQGERMEEDLQWREKIDQRIAEAAAKPIKADRSNSRSSDALHGSISDDAASQDAEATSSSVPSAFEERDDEELYFAPEKHNVIFSSALDGWAFTIRQFARLYEKKLGIKRAALEKVLWGDFYMDPKTKRVLNSKHLKGRSLKPMFVQLVLDNIWAVYEATSDGKYRNDPSMIEKITKALDLTIPPHVLRSKDPRAVMTTIFSAWLPVSTAVLVSVIEEVPSPIEAQKARMPTLIDSSPGGNHVAARVRDAMISSATRPNDLSVAFVSKMVSVPISELPQNKRRAGATLSPEEARDLARRKRAEIAKSQAMSNPPPQDDNNLIRRFEQASIDDIGNDIQEAEVEAEPEELIGFARLYSGTLSVGDEIYVIPPKYSPATGDASSLKRITVTALYMLMGRSLEALTSVTAGAIFGIGGLEGHVLKTATLCTQADGAINLSGLSMGSEPIVRVALEPENPADLPKMIEGLKLLEQSDACARYEVLESGEHVILGAGELHLERCLKDLRERFARCEIQASEPLVPYREGIVSASEMPPPKNKDLPRGTIIAESLSSHVSLRLRVRPLSENLTSLLESNAETLRQLDVARRAQQDQSTRSRDDADRVAQTEADADSAAQDRLPSASSDLGSDFLREMRDAAARSTEQKDFWISSVEQISAFGPRRNGPNVLIDKTRAGVCTRIFHNLRQSVAASSESNHTAAAASENQGTGQDDGKSQNEPSVEQKPTHGSDLSDRIFHAFQLATMQGPLCSEPMRGVAVVLEEVHVGMSDTISGDDAGRLTGEIMRMVRDSMRQGFLDWSPRLYLAMYSCEIQASTEVLGRVYAVITRRRGRILSEVVKEGTPFFTIMAVLPVAESFGLSDEIRKRTSGGAAPQLRFAGYEMLDEDPFWVPFTEDQLEDLGDTADRENIAKRYMDRVRRRKGLVVRGGKRVEGEKGRSLRR